jgi:hypothetical protein
MYFHFFFQYEVITMARRPTPREGEARQSNTAPAAVLLSPERLARDG